MLSVLRLSGSAGRGHRRPRSGPSAQPEVGWYEAELAADGRADPLLLPSASEAQPGAHVGRLLPARRRGRSPHVSSVAGSGSTGLGVRPPEVTEAASGEWLTT